MQRRAWHGLLGMMLALAALATASVAVAGNSETRLKTRLAGPAIDGLVPSGAAEFRARGSAKRFTTQVEDVNLDAGTPLQVCVNSTLLGTIILGGPPVRGGDLNLDTRDGDTVPAMTAGDSVSVWSGSAGCSGTLILSGTL